MVNLCPPALIYVVFSFAQILIDTYKGLFNTAFMKFIVATLVTFLLNSLCESGLGVISWIIVFIPFILMTFIVAMLLYIFGLNSATGLIEKQKNQKKTNSDIEINNSRYYPRGRTSPAYESFSN
jgi:predicted membrane protein